MNYYLAIDAGTSVIKTIIFNSNFKQTFSLSIKNPIIVDDYGKSELDMNLFWDLTSKCIKQAITKSKIKKNEIIGIGITGNMVGFWPINKKNLPVRNAILWNDTRSSVLFKNKNIFKNIYKVTGSITQFGCTIPILKWMTLYEK